MYQTDEGIKASSAIVFTSPVCLSLPNVAVARLYCDGSRGGGMFSLSVSELETVGISGSGKFSALLGMFSKLCDSSAGALWIRCLTVMYDGATSR